VSPQVNKSSPLPRDDNTGWSTVGEQHIEANSTIILGDLTIEYVNTRRMKSKRKMCFANASLVAPQKT